MPSKARRNFLGSSWALCFASLVPTCLVFISSTNASGRDKKREKQGATASGFPLVRFQGTYTGAANEGRSQEAHLSEGGLGSGESIALVKVLPDVGDGVGTDGNTAGLRSKRL